MPKFYLASDIHLERGELSLPNTDAVDCLLLAGDIVEIQLLKKTGNKYGYILDFFKQVSTEFKRVLWVPGIHEYWGCYFMAKSLDTAREWLKQNQLTNVSIHNNETVFVEGIPVHCTTLWTDFNSGNPLTMFDVQQSLNDYKYIRGAVPAKAGVRIKPVEILQAHYSSMQFLEAATSDNTDCIVLTHHQPLMHVLANNDIDGLEHAYANNLAEFVESRPNIKVWCAGHYHYGIREYEAYQTKFLTNCRGYVGWQPALVANFTPKLFEL